MVLPVNSSSKVLFGYFATLAVLIVSTTLFLRYRGNASAQPTPPSLDKGRFSFLANVPLVGRVYNYFNPTKTSEQRPLRIGQTNPVTSVDDLANRLMRIRQAGETQHQAPLSALIIYGKNLEITQDPGILALNPMKLILVGVKIELRFAANSLDQQMKNNGWLADADGITVVKVDTVREAITADLTVNTSTYKPYPTVYNVRT